MEVIAKFSLFINPGKDEKQTFVKGKTYRYFEEISYWQNRVVEREHGCGQPAIFNEESFYKYFEFKTIL